MKEYLDCLLVGHGAAFGVGAGIFLLTILLVAKRMIGFVLSLILMLIALGAAWTINNEELVRSYVNKWFPQTQTAPATNKAPAYTPQAQMPATTPSQAASSPISNQVENLQGQVELQKSRVDTFLEETQPTINPK